MTAPFVLTEHRNLTILNKLGARISSATDGSTARKFPISIDKDVKVSQIVNKETASETNITLGLCLSAAGKCDFLRPAA